MKTLSAQLKSHSFYYINPHITEKNFPPQPVQKKGAKILKFTGYKTGEELLALIKEQGCRPANLYELIDYIPQVQKGEWVMALGQLWEDADGNHRVPVLYRYGDGDLDFNLGYFGNDWDDGSGLLCFCDESLDPQVLKNTSDTLFLISEIEERLNQLKKLV